MELTVYLFVHKDVTMDAALPRINASASLGLEEHPAPNLVHLVNGEMIVGMSVRVSTEHNVIRFRETALAHQDGTENNAI
jgi:hypothetical protein